jgi:hypothetical protein
MKRLTIIIPFLLVLSISAHSQDPAKINREQMKALSYLVGNWKGTATIQQQGGATIKVNQEEKVQWQLDSLLISVEGIGRDPVTNKQNFHAFALLSYNQPTQQLAMRSHTHEGRQTDAYFKILEPNHFEWGFDLPGNRGKIRYTILLSEKDKTWKEKGEFLQDGTQWYPFLNMELTKQ